MRSHRNDPLCDSQETRRVAGEPSLQLHRDINPEPKPMIRSSASCPTILVVGGGVIGLVTSWVLLDKGFNVVILSKSWASEDPKQKLVSQVAGALWEFPPSVCGSHKNQSSLEKSKRWCMTAYHIWVSLATDRDLAVRSGVELRKADFFFPFSVEKNMSQWKKMKEIEKSGVLGFRRDSGLVKERNVSSSVVDAYEHLAPVIDTDRCMQWLMSIVKGKGATFATGEVQGGLLHNENQLCARFRADVIINAAGMGAGELAGDETCYPLRGALIRVKNDGKSFPKLTAALTVNAVVHKDNEIIFIVPRNNDTLVLGGIAQPNRSELDLGINSPAVVNIRKRCEEFYPALKKAKLDEECPLVQGLRPNREENVRTERQRGTRIIHSYGHGGAGWSLCFGCAFDVLGLVDEIVKDRNGFTYRSKLIGVANTRKHPIM